MLILINRFDNNGSVMASIDQICSSNCVLKAFTVNYFRYSVFGSLKENAHLQVRLMEIHQEKYSDAA